MLLTTYIFNDNQKIKSDLDEDNDFINEEIEYIKVNNIKEIREDLLNKDFTEKYIEYYVIINKFNHFRIQSINQAFDRHYIIKMYPGAINELELIAMGHSDVEMHIDSHMNNIDHENCKIC